MACVESMHPVLCLSSLVLFHLSVITSILFLSSFRFSFLSFTLSRYTRPVFVLRGRLVRRCIVPKVLTLGHKIHTSKYKEQAHFFAYIIIHLYLNRNLHRTIIGIQKYTLYRCLIVTKFLISSCSITKLLTLDYSEFNFNVK